MLDELHNIDEQLRSTKRRITRIVAASKTTLTDLYGVGPIIAATVLGYVGDIHRFASRDQFAAYNGTAPIEASSGSHIVHRLSRRGNRQLNHAIHMAAVTQIRNHGTTGRIYYERKIAEGMARKSALRALNDSASSATGSHPETPALRIGHSRVSAHTTTANQPTHPTPPAHRRPRSRRAS